MSSYLIYNDMPVNCGFCGENDDKVQMTVWWANQHGSRIRVFCDNCDRMTDYKKLNKKPIHRRLLNTSLHGQVPTLPPGPDYEWKELPTTHEGEK